MIIDRSDISELDSEKEALLKHYERFREQLKNIFLNSERLSEHRVEIERLISRISYIESELEVVNLFVGDVEID